MFVILIVILIYSKNILLIKSSPIIFKTIMVLYDDIKKKNNQTKNLTELAKLQMHLLS